MVRFAVVGSNFVTDWLIEAGRVTPGFELAAVCSRTAERAQAYAQKHSIPKTIVGTDALAADDSIDAVYIATPNLCHEAQAIQMLESGKHVLLEKPAAADYAALSRILSAAERNGRVFMEAMIPVHTPAFEAVRSLLPRLGTIRRATLSFCKYSSRYDKFKAGVVENAFRPELMNGAMMDIGIYPLNVAALLFGEANDAIARALFLPKSIDGEGTAILTYPDKLVELIYSKITDGVMPSQIQGENGCLLIDHVSEPSELRLILRDGTSETHPVLSEKPVMHYELRDFIAQVEGTPMPQFNRIAESAARMLEKIRLSAGISFQP